jgi:DNA-binding GntR family transcriptional regulator
MLEEQDGYRDWEIQQHGVVFEPIRDRNPELAEERMRAHLHGVVGRYERLGLRQDDTGVSAGDPRTA